MHIVQYYNPYFGKLNLDLQAITDYFLSTPKELDEQPDTYLSKGRDKGVSVIDR